MNVKELIDRLALLPQEAEVWVASDAEGNDHSPLDDVAKSLYHKDESIHPDDTTFDGYKDEHMWGDETEEELKADYEIWKKDLVTRVTLWPV
jgi:hypothetical protein